MENLFLPNLLLIAGTGRNSGKTTLACSIIKKFGDSYPIIAVKIAPHFHENVQEMKTIFTGESLFLAEEIDHTKPKDSSRMLAAGARKSFFVMVRDEQLQEAWNQVLSLIDIHDLIVCESGGLRNLITPGLFLMMNSNPSQTLKPGSTRFKDLCDRWITFDGKQSDFSTDSLEIQNHTWKLNS